VSAQFVSIVKRTGEFIGASACTVNIFANFCKILEQDKTVPSLCA
jgi:hypothetical protein